MILKYPQQCFKLYSNVNCVQATHLIKQFGALSYSKAYYKVPLDKDARYSPDLLQVCSQCIVPFSSKRHKSHKVPNSGKFGGGGKSAYIYAKKFLCGGMVGPKLPWMTITGQPQAKKIVPSKGGNTTSKRLTVLDQVFFDAVTDLMASGELGDRLAGRGLVITKVRVQDGLIGMQVFWSLNSGDLSCQSLASEVSKSGKPVKESVEEQSIEDLLSWAAPILRQELANLRVVGCTVPHVNFKPDMSVHNSLEVDRILLKVREELQDADDRADEAAKKERELLLGQQRRLEVPDRIFASDFVYRPVYYDAANLPTYSGKKPLSRFTPFAPRGKGLRVESKTLVDERAETDARLNGFPEDNDKISAVSSVEESAPADNPVIRVRKSTPQHGILLQNNVYGINRDRIMEKIAGCIGRMKEYTSVTNADLRFPFTLTLRLPSGEPETNENAVEHFESKKSLQNWAYKYSRRTSRNDSDEKNFLLRQSAKEARRISMEQESLKYDAFEEEVFKYTDEEDHWDEREDRE